MLSRTEISSRIIEHWDKIKKFGVRKLWLLLGVELDLITVEAVKPGLKDVIWEEAVPVEGL